MWNNGYESCKLDNKECKQIVEKAIKYVDSERYYLDKFVVMPNHVHAIVIPRGEWTLSKITHSWKSYTANELNKLTNQIGSVWMPESFDHIVRSPEQLERIRQYLVNQASSLSGRRQDACDKVNNYRQDVCVTYFSRGKLQKFFMAQAKYETRDM